jgi:hypothetical protein
VALGESGAALTGVALFSAISGTQDGEDDTMADRNGLRLVGWFYGGVTAIISLIALVVVSAHVNTPVEARPDTVIISAR